MTVAEISMEVETAASILETDTAPSLDRILLEHGYSLTTDQLDSARRILGMIETLISDLEQSA
jgi:hypothetical protein